MAMYDTVAFGKPSQDEDFTKMTIRRGETGDDDVEFDIKYCGVCHSDVHIAWNELAPYSVTKYPCVPGHELAGVVSKVGRNVTKVKVGDKVGVGCIVDSCMNCRNCKKNNEQYCEKGMTMTYDREISHGHISTKTGYTFGGYSGRLTVNERYAVKIPESYPIEKAGPVFCAGITMYSPLKQWGCLNGGKKVGIVGIGGLGQMGVRLAAAMGNEVTAISTSANKEEIARKIGATNFIISTDPTSMANATQSLDLIINTVSVDHELQTYLPLLDYDGTLVMIGATLKPHNVLVGLLFYTRNRIAGSIIGGMAETQEVIDFCAKHNIEPATELITYDKLTETYKKLSGKNDSIVRYVLDIEKSMAMN